MMTFEILARMPSEEAVAPGVGAFTLFFVLAVALALLFLNMSKHLRRVDRHRIEEEVRAEFAAEQAEKAQAERDAREADQESAAGDEEPGSAQGD